MIGNYVPKDDEPREGTCATCGGVLVQVPGERTYHPAITSDPAHPCPALLPIPGTKTAGFDVPDDQFIPESRSRDAGEFVIAASGPPADLPVATGDAGTEGDPVLIDAVRYYATAAAGSSPEGADCQCPPCPGRGNDGHRMSHCAECCFGTGVEADPGCPVHGEDAVEQEAQQQDDALREQVAAVAVVLEKDEQRWRAFAQEDQPGFVLRRDVRAALADPASVLAQRDAEVGAKVVDLFALAVCHEEHGGENNAATVYGHRGSVRTCIRFYGTDTWIYDPRWENAQ